MTGTSLSNRGACIKEKVSFFIKDINNYSYSYLQAPKITNGV